MNGGEPGRGSRRADGGRNRAASTRRGATGAGADGGRGDRRAGPRGAGRRPRVDPARRSAYDLLHLVGADDAYANLAMPTVLAEHGLGGRDAAFATELAYGTLRQRSLCDAVLGQCVDRPLDRLDPRLLDVLRLGAFQRLRMRVPPHAAVGETVALARDVAGEGPARLANAVLRRVAAVPPDAWVGRLRPTRADDLPGHLAVLHSHPRWVVSALRDALAACPPDTVVGSPEAATPAAAAAQPGDEGPASPRRRLDDELEDLLVVDNLAPSVTLVARPGRVDVDRLLGRAGVVRGRWSPYAVRLSGGAPSSVPEVRSGAAGVQDEGSQLVALALAAAPVGDGPDRRWLDLCAGPGGKAALLAGLAAERDASLTAVELSPVRADLVRSALAGASGQHEVVTADGTDGRWATSDYDRVLVDAPCTGLGVLRRRPEARWRRTPSDVARLASLQRALLRSALAAVRPGGVVGYATCSPHLAETDLVVTDVLRGRHDVEVLDARTCLPDVPGVGPGPAVRLWPHRHDTDGMYLTLLRRAPLT